MLQLILPGTLDRERKSVPKEIQTNGKSITLNFKHNLQLSSYNLEVFLVDKNVVSVSNL